MTDPVDDRKIIIRRLMLWVLPWIVVFGGGWLLAALFRPMFLPDCTYGRPTPGVTFCLAIKPPSNAASPVMGRP
jgi:hypothetical protein